MGLKEIIGNVLRPNAKINEVTVKHFREKYGITDMQIEYLVGSGESSRLFHQLNELMLKLVRREISEEEFQSRSATLIDNMSPAEFISMYHDLPGSTLVRIRNK